MWFWEFDKLGGDERDDAEGGADEEWYFVVDHPEVAAEDWQNDGSDVVDGEADGCAGRNIFRISDFVEVSSDCHGTVECDVVEDVH